MGQLKLTLSPSTDKQLSTMKIDFEKSRYLTGLLKIIALRALHAGNSVAEVADLLHTSYECVRGWLNDFLIHGVKSIERRKAAGRPKILTLREEGELIEAVKRTPAQNGYGGGCWDSKKIKELIYKLFKKTVSLKYLPEILKQLGFSFKKARIEIIGKDADARAFWLEKTWPLIVNTADKQGASILFSDEAHFSTFGTAGYTWVPTGTEALIPSRGTWETAHVIGAINFDNAKTHAVITEGKINGDVFISFLKTLLHENRKHIHLILDNAPYHRSRLVKTFMATVKNKLTVHFLPAYSPDFNPIEGLWKNIKKATTHNVYFASLQDLKAALTSQLKRLRKYTAEVKSLFGFYDKLEVN